MLHWIVSLAQRKPFSQKIQRRCWDMKSWTLLLPFAVNSESLPNSSKSKQLLRLHAFEEKGMHNNLTPVRKSSLDKMWRTFHPLDCTGVLWPVLERFMTQIGTEKTGGRENVRDSFSLRIRQCYFVWPYWAFLIPRRQWKRMDR